MSVLHSAGLILMLAAPMAGASDSVLNQVLNTAVEHGLIRVQHMRGSHAQPISSRLKSSLSCAGLIPMLAAPMAGASDSMLNQVLNAAVVRGLVKAKQHVVCVLSSRGDLVLNVCQVDERGAGLKSNLASLGEQRYAATLITTAVQTQQDGSLPWGHHAEYVPGGREGRWPEEQPGLSW